MSLTVNVQYLKALLSSCLIDCCSLSTYCGGVAYNHLSGWNDHCFKEWFHRAATRYPTTCFLLPPSLPPSLPPPSLPPELKKIHGKQQQLTDTTSIPRGHPGHITHKCCNILFQGGLCPSLRMPDIFTQRHFYSQC